MELRDTVELMNSADYKDRFKAEYYQTKIRYDKLDVMIDKYEANTLNFTPDCSIVLLKAQRNIMYEYLSIMEYRAEFEKIELHRRKR